jgi:hypothetical protein
VSVYGCRREQQYKQAIHMTALTAPPPLWKCHFTPRRRWPTPNMLQLVRGLAEIRALNGNAMKTYALMILALWMAPLALEGSGSYSSRPPRPPALIQMTKDADKEKYELGKRIYSGKARLSGQPATDAAKTQQARLRTLQARLPASAQKKTNLTTLAGRLTPAEMDALEYYVNKRFPIK